MPSNLSSLQQTVPARFFMALSQTHRGNMNKKRIEVGVRDDAIAISLPLKAVKRIEVNPWHTK